MTRIFLMLCFVVQFAMVGCAHPPVAKVTIHAVNQDGKPVTDYQFHASFWGGKEGLKKWPDENGYVTFKSPVLTDAVFSEVPKFDMHHPGVEKYYSNIVQKDYMGPRENVQDGKWQPWNPIIELVLKERINPIPMYVAGGEMLLDRSFKIPQHNQWCGFDMEEQAWIEPFGKGVHADIEVLYQWNENMEAEKNNGSALFIRFPDQNAGCYSFQYSVDRYNRTEEFKSPYHANPCENYNSEMIFSDKVFMRNGRQRVDFTHMPEGVGYVFRTRTKFDENGHLISARYGKIYPPPQGVLFGVAHNGNCYFNLCYYLNPTENDTNLEFNPEKNLFKKKSHYAP